MEKEKGSTEYIKVLQPPTSSRSPIRPKIKLNIMLAAMLGFFTMLFFAFLMEYRSKQKQLKSLA